LKPSAPAPTRPSSARHRAGDRRPGGFYLLGKQGQVAQWGALLVGLAAAFVVFCRPSRQGTDRLRPRRLEGSQEGRLAHPQGGHPDDAYVFGFVVIMALFLWLTDKTLEWVFYDLILGWKK
jgi:preprotein translocase subunit SecE